MLNSEIKYRRITPEERRKQYVKGDMLGNGAYGMVFSVKD
jgi:hypothetical protein